MFLIVIKLFVNPAGCYGDEYIIKGFYPQDTSRGKMSDSGSFIMECLLLVVCMLVTGKHLEVFYVLTVYGDIQRIAVTTRLPRALNTLWSQRAR